MARQKKKMPDEEYEPERRLVGYVRVSTEDQSLDMQIDALIKYGVNPKFIYQEKKSGKTMKRPQLALALKSLREHDTLVVWKLDRFGRDTRDMLNEMYKLEQRGVHFVSVTEGFDAATPIGKFMIQISAGLAEMERNQTAERTKAGLAVKKAAGIKLGRDHSIRDNKKRMAWLRKTDKAGNLRATGEAGGYVCIYKGGQKAIHEKLLELDTSKKQHIKNLETVRRWFRDGCPDLPPLPDEEDD